MENNKKIIDLGILTELEGSGVQKISLVEEPAIEMDFLYFKKEEFVYPSAGESKDDFISRCIGVVVNEGKDADQAAAICYSYWDSKFEAMGLDIFGYKPKNFDICPVASALFKHLASMPVSDDVIGMIRSAALQADKIFEIEKSVIAKGIATPDDVKQALLFAGDFIDLMKEIDALVGMQHDVSWVEGHILAIYELLPKEDAFDLDDACWKGYEPIGVKKKNGRTVPNCVPVKNQKFESYNDYPESAKNAAKRALEWRDSHPDQKCGTPVGWARANQLAKGENISEETIARMASFARHLQYKDVPYSEGCGGLMVDAWGGQAGIEWAQNKLEQIREEFDIDTSGLTPYEDPGVPKKKIEDILTSEHLELILELAKNLGYSEDEVDIVKPANFKFAQNPKDAAYTPARTITKADGIEYLYRYKSSSVAGNSRQFCSRMSGLNRYYSREEIDALDTFNEEFGPGVGGGQYSIFKYKGGANCQHYWQKYAVQRVGGRLQAIEAFPSTRDEQLAASAPRTFQGRGFVKRPQRNLPPLSGVNQFSKMKLNFADEEKKTVVGPAMIPDISIPRRDEETGDVYYVKFSEETVREIAMKYMKEARTNDTNTDHLENVAGAYVYESWIVEDPKGDKAKTVYGYDVPKGTWMVAMKVENPETWKRIKAGELKGFSVEGAFADMEEIENQKRYEKIVSIIRG